MANSKQRAVALVTGGNRGIGLAIATQLARSGIQVAVGCRRIEQGESAIKPLLASGLPAEAVELDVTNDASRQAAVGRLLERHGRIDILVNNAGVALDKWVPVQSLDPAVLRATLETNLYAPMQLCQLVLPSMKERGHGRIVNLSSELGSLAESRMGGSAAYRISKTALNMLTRLLALELKEHPDILVNAAAPGWVRTELGGDDAPRTPEEGARTPVWLATLPAGGPNGGFFRDNEPYPW
jgi:NAD(P)-dependent dehydrogenase (short-subunit alcohol dehydrogenase family)